MPHTWLLEASEKLNFEEAAKLRDTIRSIQDAYHTTHVELSRPESYDVFAIEILENPDLNEWEKLTKIVKNYIINIFYKFVAFNSFFNPVSELPLTA